MLSKLVACWLVLAMLCGFAPSTPDPLGIGRVEAIMTFPGVTDPVHWESCGTVNAYYDPATHEVTLCTELKAAAPGLVRFALAHEMAHGIIEQLDIPITGTEEWAADELAAVLLIANGHTQDVIDASDFWLDMRRPEDPYDVHLGDLRRSFNLACLAVSHDGPVGICGADYRRSLRAWVRLLGLTDGMGS